ncbi:MAG: type II toxin-antitoxin system MqsA family antitoxin [Proteobacteria bacterium]|nr:type II toxin-antitoxin system MqsA family antitoxin [Pseudomonadota bacterium]
MIEKRDIGQEILESIQSIKKGYGLKRTFEIPQDVCKVRKQLELSQSSFAALMGVSVRTLQEWEQGRRHPSGPALSLLRIAQKHPEAFVDL